VPDVGERRGTEEGIHRGVKHDVGIGVAGEPALAREIHPAQPQRLPLREAVHVEPMTDADGEPPAPLDTAPGLLPVVGCRDLDVPRVARDERDRDPRPLERFRVVGGLDPLRDRAVKGAEEVVAPAALGRLGEAERPAVERGRDEASAVVTLDGVRDGEDGDGGRAILGALGRERTASRRRLARALGSARYFALLDRLEAAADPPLADPSPDLSLAAIWRAEHSTLKKAVTRLGEAPGDDDLHAVRIKVKRARYAAELARLEPYVRAAKALQDVLGEHQDSVVAEARLRGVAAGRPETAIAAGRLVEREHERRASAAAAWQERWTRLAREAKRV